MTKHKEPKDTQLRVSPAAQKLAAELGIDIDSLQGSGSQGRIVLADIERAQLSSSLEGYQQTAYHQKVSLPSLMERGNSV